ncbi:caspase [Colletotrichum tofieldiae]|nr:caspase [Colletotrichum tofieldiae]
MEDTKAVPHRSNRSGYGYQQPSPQPYGYNQQYGGYQQPPQPNYNSRPGEFTKPNLKIAEVP